MTILNPYISFAGQAKEALDFYHSVFGGEVTVDTFRSFGMTENLRDEEFDLVMHGQLEAPGGLVLMASDSPSYMGAPSPTSNITISLSGDDDARLRGYWAGLAEGGEITLPLDVAPWGAAFGQLKDRFGTEWMFNISPAA